MRERRAVAEQDSRFLEGFARRRNARRGIDRFQSIEAVRQPRIGGDRGIAGIDPAAGEHHRPAGERSGGVPFDHQQLETGPGRTQQYHRCGSDRGHCARCPAGSGRDETIMERHLRSPVVDGHRIPALCHGDPLHTVEIGRAVTARGRSHRRRAGALKAARAFLFGPSKR